MPWPMLQNYIRRHVRLDRPAHHFAVEQINDYRQAQPAFIRPDVGDVRCPSLIRCGRCKLALQQVRRYQQHMHGVGGRLETPLVQSADAVPAHQPLDAPLARRKSPRTQLMHHARTAVCPLQFRMNRLQQCHHLRIRQTLTFRSPSALPCTVAADTDNQGLAHFRQLEFRPLRINPGVLHSASFAKYAAVFLRFRTGAGAGCFPPTVATVPFAPA